MPGINLTGRANTADYNLGRGRVYFAPLLASGMPGAYRDLGNAPEFNINVEVETLEHQSSRQGLRVTDKEIVISQKVNLSLQLDEINFENVALFFSGTTEDDVTNVAVAGFTKYTMIENVEKGRWYDIVNSSDARAYDIDASNLTLEEGTTTLTKGSTGTADVEVDEVMGRLFFRPESANLTYSGTEDIDVTLAADSGAKSIDEVKALTQTSVSGALKFLSENPANNDFMYEYQFHQVSLKAEGDFGLISDDITTMGFTGVAEQNASADADSPTLTIRTHELATAA